MLLNTPRTRATLWLVALSYISCTNSTGKRLCTNLDVQWLTYFDGRGEAYFENFFVNGIDHPEFEDLSVERKCAFIYKRLLHERPDFKWFCEQVQLPAYHRGDKWSRIFSILFLYGLKHGYFLEWVSLGTKLFSRITGKFTVSLADYPAIADLLGITDIKAYEAVDIYLVDFVNPDQKWGSILWVGAVRPEECIDKRIISNELLHMIAAKEGIVEQDEDEEIHTSKRTATEHEANEFLSNVASITTIVQEWWKVTDFILFTDDVMLYCQSQIYAAQTQQHGGYMFNSKFAWHVFTTYGDSQVVHDVQDALKRHKDLRNQLLQGTNEELTIYISQSPIFEESYKTYCIDYLRQGTGIDPEERTNIVEASVYGALLAEIGPYIQEQYPQLLSSEQQQAITQEYLKTGKLFVNVLRQRNKTTTSIQWE